MSFTYDQLYRLTGEVTISGAVHTYGYDAAGNRTSVNGQEFRFDDANKLLSFGATTARYDDTTVGGGNMTELSGAGLAYRKMAWDALGNLTVLYNQDGSVASTQAYDAAGTRVWTQRAGGQSIFYVYDGDQVIGEITNSVDPNPIKAVYTWGADGLVSQRLSPTSTSPLSLWYHYGPQGETRQLTNSSGEVTDRYFFNAWGVPIATFGQNPNPFRFGGKFGYYTLPYGLIQCGARWYDPQQGRWVSRDPIGYAGGDNLYGYCRNNPITWVDPLGLDTFVFNGATLKRYATSGPNAGKLIWWVKAASGVPGSRRSDQNRAWRGPTVDGIYYFETGNIQKYTDSQLDKILGYFSGSRYYTDSRESWGQYRVELFPDKATAARIAAMGREGHFFLHGGDWIGSAGCVDIGPSIDGLLKNMINSTTTLAEGSDGLYFVLKRKERHKVIVDLSAWRGAVPGQPGTRGLRW